MTALKTPSTTQVVSLFYQKVASCFAAFSDTIDFLGRIGWPIVDFLFRVWIAKQLLVSAVLLANGWDTSILLATYEYPISWLPAKWEAFLGIAAQFIGGISLMLGLCTRFGALVTLVFALFAQIYYVSLDVHLFWLTIMLGCVLRGPSLISLDHILSQGFSRSALPLAMSLVKFCNITTALFSNYYLIGLRLWLMITLFLVTQHIQAISAVKIQVLSSWLPLHSALFIFGNSLVVLAFLLGFGFAPRLAAIAGIIIICLNSSMAGASSYPAYWLMLMAILFVAGPGAISLDQLILDFLKKRYPQLSGKPAFCLDNLPHVVIIGAGFGGIACAKSLRHVPVKVTLIDRHNYHLFQPLLYQVATGNLSPGDIAISIRSIFLDQFNVDVMLRNVTAINKEERYITADEARIHYDYLVVATGATHSYFGKEVWEPYAPGLKAIGDATTVRSRLLKAFELAELADTPEEQQHFLNFVIVGAGPTGVELAGSIAELARFGMEKDFRRFDPASANIILVQAAPRILPTFSEEMSKAAHQSLEGIGVTVLTDSRVEQIDCEGVIVNGQRIYSKSVLWAAGVTASPAAKWLQVESDPAGRVKVISDLSVADYPEIFVIGDTASSNGWAGKPVPGLAPAAKQGGIYVAKNISKAIYKKTMSKEFKYKHLGSLATIGRKSAVAEFSYFKVNGEAAWWLWGLVHVSFLLGGRNRLSVIVNWMWSYFTFRANNLLITEILPDKE